MCHTATQNPMCDPREGNLRGLEEEETAEALGFELQNSYGKGTDNLSCLANVAFSFFTLLLLFFFFLLITKQFTCISLLQFEFFHIFIWKMALGILEKFVM